MLPPSIGWKHSQPRGTKILDPAFASLSAAEYLAVRIALQMVGFDLDSSSFPDLLLEFEMLKYSGGIRRVLYTCTNLFKLCSSDNDCKCCHEGVASLFTLTGEISGAFSRIWTSRPCRKHYTAAASPPAHYELRFASSSSVFTKASTNVQSLEWSS